MNTYFDPNNRTYCAYDSLREKRGILIAYVAPFREAIMYDAPVIFEATPFSNDFTGPPRPEHEAAWHELLTSRFPL
jgi:hypothetical protein